jgi:hypothetical protein
MQTLLRPDAGAHHVSSTRVSAVREVLANPHVRIAQLAFFIFVTAEHATWVAALVFAFRRGGTSEASLAGFGQLGLAALVAPLASYWCDRADRRVVVRISLATQGLLCAACALALLNNASAFVVYAIAATLAIAITLSRPALCSLLPDIVPVRASGARSIRSAQERSLVAGNLITGSLHHLGLLIGPAIAAALLRSHDVASVYLAAAVALAIGCVVASRLVSTFDGRSRETQPGPDLGSAHRAAMAGLALMLRTPRVRALIVLIGGSMFLVGAADVAAVAVGIDLLHGGDATAAALTASIGFGGLIGAALAVRMVDSGHLVRSLVRWTVFAAVPFALIGAAGVPWTAAFAFAGVGMASCLVDVAGTTALQLSVPSELMGRVFGVVEGMRMAALAGGSFAVGIANGERGLRMAFVVIAACLTVVMVWQVRTLHVRLPR